MADALLFPGQGSQAEGMRELVSTHRPDLLDLALRECDADPFDRADESTAYAQPAILCASLAAWEAAGRPHASFYAGHSLGELSALAAAGAIEEADALRLAAIRGRVMRDAAGEAPGGMLALLGDAAEAREAAASAGVVVANDNASTQLVVAGPLDGIEAAEREAGDRGLRAIRLAVRGAFHTPAMEAAVPPFRAALEEVAMAAPAHPVFSSITASPFASRAAQIRDQLAAALVRPVRWRETMIELHRLGVRELVETGPGKALTRMAKRAFDDVDAQVLRVPEPVRA
jgi:[acyl-carrier-protein] S-malonyltransferase